MNILTAWLRTYVPNIPVDDHKLAEDLTLRGIAVEGIHALGASNGQANGHLYEMDITTNRVDAMNHYGIAREAATIYNLPLAPLNTKLPIGSLVDEPTPIVTSLLCATPRAELLAQIAETTAGSQRGTAVVGHEPWLGELVAWLAFGDARFGEALDLKKAGVVWLSGTAVPGGMMIRAMLPPKMLRGVR